jgi:hypothetical protein
MLKLYSSFLVIIFCAYMNFLTFRFDYPGFLSPFLKLDESSKIIIDNKVDFVPTVKYSADELSYFDQPSNNYHNERLVI